MKISRLLALSVLMATGLTGSLRAAEYTVVKPAENVLKIIKETKDLSKFAALVASAGIENELSAKGSQITLFAPTNAAMDKLPADVMKKAKEQKDGIKSLVQYHIIQGSIVYAGNIKGRRASPSSMNGEMIGFDGTGKELMVGPAVIVTPDQHALNGIVHIVNAPLVPFSLDEKAKEKEKAAQEAERKKMEDEMKAREAKMAEERAKVEAERAKADAEKAKQEAKEETKKEGAAADEGKKPSEPAPAPKTDEKAAAPAAKAPVKAPVAPAPAAPAEKTEEKSGLKKLFGF